MMSKTIKIADIKIPKGGRTINKENVAKLAENIKEVGLINPITVSRDMELIAGQHRLEAMKLNKEKVIDCRIADIDFDNDNSVVIRWGENEFRTGLLPSEKVALYKKIKEIRDARRKNGGNSTRKIDTVSKKQKNKEYKERENKDSKEAGFTDQREKAKATKVVNSGIIEVINAVDEGKITITRGAEIAKLPKNEQKKALNDFMNGAKPKKTESKTEDKGTRAHNKSMLDTLDKFGSYTQVRIYKNNPAKTAENIAKCFGDGFKKPFISLLSEMIITSKKHSLGQNDMLYNTYDFGITSLSIGDILEVFELYENKMNISDIAGEFGVSPITIQKVLKQDISKYKKDENENSAN